MRHKIGAAHGDVIEYYEKNWKSIDDCYNLDSDGLPIDSAWYRRRIYIEILKKYRPQEVLDLGCGGGQTVLDGLEMGLNVSGFEPIEKLVKSGQIKLKKNGFNSAHIMKGDASHIVNIEAEKIDLVALLSVIPHISKSEWDPLHREISRVLKDDALCVIAYRNELFDLYTANRLTFEFFLKNFFKKEVYSEEMRKEITSELKNFIPFFEEPEPNFTQSNDKTFGMLERPKSNPLEIHKYLCKFDLFVENILFCNFHPVLPQSQMMNRKELKIVKHNLELTLFDQWEGYFMSSMFVVLARKLNNGG